MLVCASKEEKAESANFDGALTLQPLRVVIIGGGIWISSVKGCGGTVVSSCSFSRLLGSSEMNGVSSCRLILSLLFSGPVSHSCTNCGGRSRLVGNWYHVVKVKVFFSL